MSIVRVLAVALLGLVFSLVGCAPSENVDEVTEKEPLSALSPPPLPPLDTMEPAVRAQFEERAALLEQVLANPKAVAYDVAWALGQMGRLHQAYRFVDQALWYYEAAHNQDPETFAWAYLLGHLQMALGDPTAAQPFFERAAQLRPDIAGSFAALGRLELEAGNLEAATEHYRATLELDDKHALARHGLAQVEIQQGRLADAVERLRRLLDEQPRAYQVHYALADALRRLGREDEARVHLDSIPESTVNRISLRTPDPWIESIQDLLVSATAIDRRGRMALLDGRAMEALRLFRQAEAAAPDRREIQFNLATALFQTGQLDEAIERLRRMNQTFPDFSGAFRLLGRALQSRGETTEARRLLQKAADLDPEAESNHRALGDLYLATDQPKLALVSFERALYLSSRSAEGHIGLGLAQLMLERYEEADQTFRRGIQVRPRSRPLQWLRLRSLAGSRSDAIPPEPPTPPQTLFELETAAMSRASQGSFEAAIRWQENAVRLAQAAESAERRRLAEDRLARYRAGRSVGKPWVALERVQVASRRAGSPSRTR